MDQLKNYFIILLAAGSGSRMGTISKKIPKSLLRVGTTTPLDLLVEKLRQRGVKEINIILGFEHKKILEHLKKYKNIKFNYLIVKNFLKNGSVWSLYKSYNLWRIKKYKVILMFHTDLIFNNKFLDNIIKSKKKNIIGVRQTKKQKLKDKSFVAEVGKSMQIKKIGKLKEVKKPFGEIICINKFSDKTFKKLFYFLKDYFKNNSKNITWEYPVSNFAKKNKLYALKKQNFEWVNINTRQDLVQARRNVA